MVHKLLCLALAGALGTLARYGFSGLVQRSFGASFPWGTLAVNVLGCFLAGAVWALAENRVSISGEARTIVLVGFMGAFTTFSAFILETGEIVREAQWAWAAGNVLLQNGLGIGVFFLGMALGRLV
jgi:fluoride exporter